MKKTIYTLLIILTIQTNCFAQSNEQILLNSFHKFGITNCDSFILENNRLQENFSIFISKHSEGIDGPSTEVSITTIYGKKGDTIKFDDSYIQTVKNCFLHSKLTTTHIGSCKSVIDTQEWSIETEMPNKDYTTYKSKMGLDMQAKEIEVGEAKVCIIETSIRLRKK